MDDSIQLKLTYFFPRCIHHPVYSISTLKVRNQQQNLNFYRLRLCYIRASDPSPGTFKNLSVQVVAGAVLAGVSYLAVGQTDQLLGRAGHRKCN